MSVPISRTPAATISPEHLDRGGFFGGDRPEGDDPVELGSGTATECADSAADWYRRRLAS